MRGISARRAGPVAALVVCVAIAASVLLGGGQDTQRLVLRMTNASQLVQGNEVKVGGVAVGTVQDIRLTDDSQAEVEIEVADDELVPLRRGTRAWVRVSSLSGVANRYVALEPGPNDAPELADGGIVPTQDTRAAVDLDAVLATLDADTRAHLQRLSRGNAAVYAGRSRELNRGLAALNPAVAQLEGTLRELGRDRAAFERFVVAGAGWVSAVAERSGDLRGALSETAATARAVARERTELAGLLREAPAALTQARGTLRRTAGTLDAVAPAAREARPVAPRLSRFLAGLEPVLDRTGPALDQVEPLLRDLRPALASQPAVRDLALPAFRSATTAIDRAMPIVTGLRAYWPDVLLGMTNGFGGTAAGTYDANGSYGRIGAVAGPYSLAGALGTLVPTPDLNFRAKNLMRCPGAATQVEPGGSNLVKDTGGVPCKEEHRP
jgi:phospholipid/cholesterol/gamma-HCH transport system substrate-binding protein